MFLHAGRQLNRCLKSLINHDDEKTPDAIERLVHEFHEDKELCCYQLLNHSGSEDILWGIVRLLGCKDPSVAGHAAYVIGTICDTDIGRRRILEVVVNYKDHGFDVLGNLTRILYCKDNESIMNASGAIGTLAETVAGRSWMLRKEALDETISRIMILLGSDDVWTASNAALIIARLTIEEEGCARILNRRDTKKILLQLVCCLGIDDGGKGLNAAFAIGRICDMESGRRQMLMLKKSDYMLSKLSEMLESNIGGCNKNACFALSCIAGSADGVVRLLEHPTRENILHRLSFLLSAEDEETAWFAAMMLRTLASKKMGCLLLRDHKVVNEALQERAKVEGLKDDIKDEIQVTLEILKRLDKPEPPVVKIESATTVNIHWNAVSPKNGLEVTYKLLLDNPEETIAYCGQDTSFELQSLKPAKSYTCRLQMSTEGDISPISKNVSFSTPESVPSAPQNARVLGRTTTQVKLGWDPPHCPNGLVKGYQVCQIGKSGFSETRDLYCIITSLMSGTEYSFEIYALTSAGRGDKADVTCATVDLREHAPPKPTLSVLGRNEILIQWKPPEQPLGRINNYVVTQDGEVIYTGIERTCTSRRLQPNTEYTFKVAAWTNEGKCESEPAKKRTAKNVKSNFPRDPLFYCDKKPKSGKFKQERTPNWESAYPEQQRAKSVPSSALSKTTRDAIVRPKTSAETWRAQPKRTLGYSKSAPGYSAVRNQKENMQRSNARRRHLSTGSSVNSERFSPQMPFDNSTRRRNLSTGTIGNAEQPGLQFQYDMRRSSDYPTIITIASPITKDSLIGLNFAPGQYTGKPPLKISVGPDHSLPGSGVQNWTQPKAKKSVSFSTPFSQALEDLQTMSSINNSDNSSSSNNNNSKSNNNSNSKNSTKTNNNINNFVEFPSSILSPRSIPSPYAGFPRRSALSPSKGGLKKHK